MTLAKNIIPKIIYRYMKNILNKDEQQSILESLISKYVDKYKDELKVFIKKLKEQFKFNKQAREILTNYAKDGNISKEESILLKEISVDILKMLGLSSVVILPGGSLLIVFIIKLAKILKVDVIPSQFSTKEIQ